MSSRFTTTGLAADNTKVLLAYELNEAAFKITLTIIPEKLLSAADTQHLKVDWVKGEPFDFPEGATHIEPDLSAESILPNDIRSEETGKIRSIQHDWAITLLTSKIWESYLTELELLKSKADALAQYDRTLFDDAKSFWERVLDHRKANNISQQMLDKIKDDVNSIFEKLKTFKKNENAEFDATSSKMRNEVLDKLEDLKKRAGDKANFKLLMEELKQLQTESRKNRYTKSDDALLRKNFDSVFSFINEQRNHFFSDMNASRVKGLNEVIERMESMLARDRKELDVLQRKSESNKATSLEVQLTKVKTKMLNETIASKEDKLKDIRLTLAKLLKQSGKSSSKSAMEEFTNETEPTTPSASE